MQQPEKQGGENPTRVASGGGGGGIKNKNKKRSNSGVKKLVRRNGSSLSLGSSNKVAPREEEEEEEEEKEEKEEDRSTPASLFASGPAENPLSSFAAALALKHRKRSRLSHSLRTARVLTPAAAAAALATLVASLATPDWLRTVERMPNRNRTVLWGPDKSPEYLEKLSHSGLFQLCSTARESGFFCQYRA